MQKWLRTNIKEVLRANVFKYKTHESISPLNGEGGVFDVVSCYDWVNVVCIDSEGRYIFVKQYRHGTDELTIETPAGAIERGEKPLSAAKRELLEETGYESDNWTDLGRVKVNPAFMTNSCHIFLAQESRHICDQKLDRLEDIKILSFSKEEVKRLISTDEINHSLVQLALYKSFIN